MCKMEKSYLETDSLGILPMDLEKRTRYLARGGKFAIFNISNKNEIKEALEKAYVGSSFVESRAPEDACAYMIQKYDRNLFWVPFYKAEQVGNDESSSILKESGGICSHFSKVDDKRSNYPAIVISPDSSAKDLAVHEMIHSVRCTMNLLYQGHEEIMAYELRRYSFFSRSKSLFPRHDEIWKDISESRKTLKILAKAYRRLEDCFGDKADYALIRLNRQEIIKIAEMGSRKVAGYFKMRASEGFLRSEIMCEKLGL